jgi:hypothetical protein
MFTIFLAGLASWIATSTIVEAEVFRDVREACEKLHDKHTNWWTYKLQYFIRCHMCTGIWVSALIALFIPPFVSIPVIGWGLTALAIKGIGHSFLVLQKFFEAATDRKKAETAWSSFDLMMKKSWTKEHVDDAD